MLQVIFIRFAAFVALVLFDAARDDHDVGYAVNF